MQKMGFYRQGHSNSILVHTIKYDSLFLCSELLIFWGDQLGLTVHVHKLEYLVKRLLCCSQGQGHSEGSELK